MANIQDIEVSMLENHPLNVRTTYENIDELADSIRAKGVMQNLTVVPKPGEPGRYYVVIGNRRLMAAKKAGVETVPCWVSDMDEKEQVSTMMTENMQRENLTICEEAQGFQMMLDFGETQATIAEKTGFSRTTVKHRVELAKLDQVKLKERQDDKSFQLSLTDLYELEKLADVEKRNKILSEARGSRDLVWRVQTALGEEKRDENERLYIMEFEKLGIQEATQEVKDNYYKPGFSTIATFDLDKKPEEISLDVAGKEAYYFSHYNYMSVIIRTIEKPKEKTPEELEMERIAANKEKLQTINKDMQKIRKNFIRGIISGTIEKVKDENAVIMQILDIIFECDIYLGMQTVVKFYTGKEDWNLKGEEKKNALEIVEKWSLLHRMLAVMSVAMNGYFTLDYSARYDKKSAEKLKKGYDVLRIYGFSFSPEYESVLDGTSELYNGIAE